MEHVVVVGAGIVGLSTAWQLQRRGVAVTVLERSEVAAGASFGNAGWITPAMAVPLADPAVLRYGLAALTDPTSPVSVPPQADPGLALFLARLLVRCRMPVWRRTLAALTPLNRLAIAAYDELEDAGVAATVRAPILAAFDDEAALPALRHELDLVAAAGQPVRVGELTGDQVRALAPVGPGVVRGLRIEDQRHLDPPRYLAALAAAVRRDGGTVSVGAQVGRTRHGAGGLVVDVVGAGPVRADAVVLATGAWLPRLAGPHGVRVPLRAGRGYSFSVPGPAGGLGVPVYFPAQRVVATPLSDGRVRLGGTMEFRDVDAPLATGRVEALAAAAAGLLPGLDCTAPARRDTWVGARPVTVDGLPLVGPTRTPGVWVHGGHGMWGMCHGPATARLLAEQMVTGRVPDPLRPLDPLRGR
jgi:D-amino-acid dehydrogenase